MAVNLGSIYTEFRLKLSSLQQDVLKANALVQEASSQMQSQATTAQQAMDKKYQAMGKSMVTAGTVMTAVGAAGALGIKKLVDASAEWETAFTGVKKTVDEVRDSNGDVVLSYDDIEKSLRNMSKTMPATAKEIAGVAEAAGQLGIKTEDVEGFTKTMVDMSVSTNMTSNEAATSFARFANIVGMSPKDFRRAGSAVVELGNNYATTESEITAMSLRLAGAGKQVGLSSADIFGLSTALSSLGIRSEMGGSAFSKAMINMQVAASTGLGPAKDLMEKTGMSMRDLELLSANNSKGFKDLAQGLGMTADEMKNVIKHNNDLEEFGKIAGMSAEQFKQAFETDATGAISAFLEGLGNANEKGTTAVNLLDEMGIKEVRLRDTLLRSGGAHKLVADAVSDSNRAWEENTALTEEAEKRYETFDSKLIVFKNRINDIAINLGDGFKGALASLMDSFEPVLKAIEDMAQKYSQLDPAMQATIAKTAILGTAFLVLGGPITLLTGKMLPGLMKGFAGVTNKAIPDLLGKLALLSTNLPIVGSSMTGVSASLTSSSAAMAGMTASLGALAAVAAVVVAVIASMALAVKNNTYKVRELLASFGRAMSDFFKQIKDQFASISDVGEPLIGFFEAIMELMGATIWYGFVGALALIADAVKVVIATFVYLVKVTQSAYYALEAAGYAMTGQFSKAKESAKKSGKAFSEAGDALIKAFDPANSTLVKTFEGIEKTGEASTKAAKVYKVSNDQIKASIESVGRTNENTNKSIEQSNNQLQELLRGGVDEMGNTLSETSSKYLEAAGELYSKYSEKAKKAGDKYTKDITKAEKLGGKERLDTIAKVNDDYAKAISNNNLLLITLNKDYAQILKDNKWADGQELTKQQREILEQQTKDIQAEMARQNQEYAKAQLMRIDAGKKLSNREKQTTIEVLKSTYSEMQQNISAGEETLNQLRQQKSEAANDTEKANIQLRIDQQMAANKKLKEDFSLWADDMIAVMANNGNLTAQSWGTAIATMGPLTDEQLGLLVTKFNDNTNNIDESLKVFGQVVGQRGGEGAAAFVTAIQNGDYQSAGLAMNDGVMKTIEGLPQQMFDNGQAGKDKFIERIKAGDYVGAGKYLAGGVDDGIKDKLPGIGERGSEGGIDFAGKVKSKANDASLAGGYITEKAATGALANKDLLGNAGKKSAEAAKTELEKDRGWASIGGGIISGVVKGVTNNDTLASTLGGIAENALSAAKSKLGINSPSRVFRDQVGRFIPEGIAVGIDNYASTVDSSMDNLFNLSRLGITDFQESLANMNLGLNGSELLGSMDANQRIIQGSTSIVNNIFNAPLVGNASIRDERDIATLSQELQLRIDSRQKIRGKITPNA